MQGKGALLFNNCVEEGIWAIYCTAEMPPKGYISITSYSQTDHKILLKTMAVPTQVCVIQYPSAGAHVKGDKYSCWLLEDFTSPLLPSLKECDGFFPLLSM